MLLCWLGVAAMAQVLVGQHARYQPARPIYRAQDLFLDLLGEGRTLVARVLWFKADLYHEQQDAAGVDAFQQKEVIPLLRMVTYLDPTFADAYDVIAYDLQEGYGQTRAAVDLVDEGLLYNPRSYALNFRRALLAEKQLDPIRSYIFARRAFSSPDQDANQFLTLKVLRRATLRMRDARSGLEVVELMKGMGLPDPDPELTEIWRRELQGKGVKIGSPPPG
ncbi:hypothetical protein JST97_08895 [bacterium]|nr:hypothetical protein [bacterium]